MNAFKLGFVQRFFSAFTVHDVRVLFVNVPFHVGLKRHRVIQINFMQRVELIIFTMPNAKIIY